MCLQTTEAFLLPGIALLLIFYSISGHYNQQISFYHLYHISPHRFNPNLSPSPISLFLGKTTSKLSQIFIHSSLRRCQYTSH